MTNGHTSTGNAAAAKTNGSTPTGNAAAAKTNGSTTAGNAAAAKTNGRTSTGNATAAKTNGSTSPGNATAAKTDGSTPGNAAAVQTFTQCGSCSESETGTWSKTSCTAATAASSGSCSNRNNGRGRTSERRGSGKTPGRNERTEIKYKAQQKPSPLIGEGLSMSCISKAFLSTWTVRASLLSVYIQAFQGAYQRSELSLKDLKDVQSCRSDRPWQVPDRCC